MEYGAARVDNGPHLMVKNFVQFSIAMIFYWFLGFGFPSVTRKVILSARMPSAARVGLTTTFKAMARVSASTAF